MLKCSRVSNYILQSQRLTFLIGHICPSHSASPEVRTLHTLSSAVLFSSVIIFILIVIVLFLIIIIVVNMWYLINVQDKN